MKSFTHVRVLVVDDMTSMRMLIKGFLHKLGIVQIEEAQNGEAAWEKITTMTFDLIICDWDMPKMTGIELLKTLKQQPAYQAIPFVMLTANAQRAHVEEAIQQGVDGYIHKPFKPNVFIERVRDLLQRHCSL